MSISVFIFSMIWDCHHASVSFFNGFAVLWTHLQWFLRSLCLARFLFALMEQTCSALLPIPTPRLWVMLSCFFECRILFCYRKLDIFREYIILTLDIDLSAKTCYCNLFIHFCLVTGWIILVWSVFPLQC